MKDCHTIGVGARLSFFSGRERVDAFLGSADE